MPTRGAQGLKPSNIGQTNKKAVLRHFILHDKCSLTQVSQALGLSRTAVARAVSEYVAQGVLLDIGKGVSTVEGGKPPEMFTLCDTALCSLSVRLNFSDVVIEMRSLKAERMGEIALPLSDPEDYRGMIQCVGRGVEAALREGGVHPQRVIGVVVGGDGLLDGQRGVLLRSTHHPQWGEEVPILEDMKSATGLRDVAWHLGNMVYFAGWAHRMRHPQEKLALLLLAGVSGSCVVEERDGESYSELVHCIVEPHTGEKCPVCGRRGCFSERISTRRALRLYAERARPGDALYGKDGYHMDAIFAAADAGDAPAREILDEMAGHLDVLLHNLRVTARPQRVLIGERYRAPGTYFAEKLQGMLEKEERGRLDAPMAVQFGGGFEEFSTGAAWYAAMKYVNETAQTAR